MRQMYCQVADRSSHQRTARNGAHAEKHGLAFGKVNDLKRFRKFDQTQKTFVECLFGPNGAGDLKAFFGKKARILSQFLIADAGNTGRDVEKLRSEQTDRHIGFVVGGDGKNHVGVVGTGAFQHRRREGVTGYSS